MNVTTPFDIGSLVFVTFKSIQVAERRDRDPKNWKIEDLFLKTKIQKILIEKDKEKLKYSYVVEVKLDKVDPFPAITENVYSSLTDAIEDNTKAFKEEKKKSLKEYTQWKKNRIK